MLGGPIQAKMELKSQGLRSKQAMCNICRQGSEDGELISPCQCTGSMGHVHFECLKVWIETSYTNQCYTCKVEYQHPCFTMHKSAGKFEKFFHESEMGERFSQFKLYFFIMFYMVYFSCFHSRLIYSSQQAALAVTITVLNSVFFILHTVIFLIYLTLMRLSFVHWQENHFEIRVCKHQVS